MIARMGWMASFSSSRITSILALGIGLAAACSGGGGGGQSRGSLDGGVGADAEVEPDAQGSLTESPVCRSDYPAHACDGDPHGQWTLAALCLNRYADCSGARVRTTGSATASLEFRDAWPEAMFEYSYDYDLETRLSVPAACLGGASCETIGCFAGDDPCSCVLGSSSGGSVSDYWTPDISGEVVAEYPGGSRPSTLRFCAGATTADSEIGGRRIIWQRVCTEDMDCRPSNPCHLGKAHCARDSISCEDTGENRPVGSVCGSAEVCDATGACVSCPAGEECSLENQPCKAATISCTTAEPRCVAKGNLPDGTPCGEDRQCLNGVCKAEDGAACTSDDECEDACTCGDAQCLTSYCGSSCTCRYAPPGGACAGVLDDGAKDPGSCNKSCFGGRCLADIGERCTRDAECGSGHCTCWLPTCSGGRLCSKPACPCQWASSGSDTCAGPLMDGLGDLACASPQMCVQGACQ
jgi:hypothetical protein